jgi:hypothetical protein
MVLVVVDGTQVSLPESRAKGAGPTHTSSGVTASVEPLGEALRRAFARITVPADVWRTAPRPVADPADEPLSEPGGGS